jgi:hypothetical protein
VVAIGERAAVREALAASCRSRGDTFDAAVARYELAEAVRRGAARAGVRELRHVPRLRGAGTAFKEEVRERAESRS